MTVGSRFVIAIAVMIATERYADSRLDMMARQFRAGFVLLPGFGEDQQ